MTAAEVLCRARKARGLSQSEVAARAGTSQPVVSAYENGRRDPSIRTLRRLVAATGEQLDVGLAARSPAVPPPSSAEEHGLRLLQVLEFADAVPRRRRPDLLAGPRIVSTR